MNKKNPIIALIFTIMYSLCITSPSVAIAEEEYVPEGHWYGEFNTSYALNTTTGDNLNGLSLSPRLGYDVNRCWGMELESGWTLLEGKDMMSGGGTDNIHAFPLLLNLNLRRPKMIKNVVPYLTGGIGMYFFGVDHDREDVPGEVKMDTAEFGGKVATGIDYYLSTRTAISLETGYHFINNPRVRAYSATAQDESFKLQAGWWYIGAGLKYRF